MTRRFLVTGLPRIRSAWLAALFSAPPVTCFHDSTHHGGVDKMLDEIVRSRDPILGLIDPGAACVYPREAVSLFAGCPIIVVARNEEDCRTGLENWFGAAMTNWDELMQNNAWFQQQLVKKFYVIGYESLDDYKAVAEMYNICTGLELDKRRFDLFNTLKIEQHFEKAAQAAMSLRH